MDSNHYAARYYYGAKEGYNPENSLRPGGGYGAVGEGGSAAILGRLLQRCYILQGG